MTLEQLLALMAWVRAAAQFEIAMDHDADIDGSYEKAMRLAEKDLYEAFGAEEKLKEVMGMIKNRGYDKAVKKR